SGTGFPQRYNTLRERGYSIRGELDLNAYVNDDLTRFDKKLTSQYPERVPIRNVLDVLYAALRKCKATDQNHILPELRSIDRFLSENASRKKPAAHTVRHILQEPCLHNSLYAGFRQPLQFAQMLLQSEDLMGTGESSNGCSYLMDASFLWETYLYELMHRHLGSEWEVNVQYRIPIYVGSFFGTHNYPDFVLTNTRTGDVYVLDAKFKKMRYDAAHHDVDLGDLRQVHTYACYLAHALPKKGQRLRGAGLIYPSQTSRPAPDECEFPLFGISDAQIRFGIFSVQDGANDDELKEHEKAFIEQLRQFLQV
ncbi:MAG: McrC family protein, partial [Oscillospiraceae bacterium]|nr:McrC family protein [Oscillospiraceae bacterium]